MDSMYHTPRTGICISLLLCLLLVAACSGTQRRAAGEGAAAGAVVGAVGGLVTGLVFGGNAAESAARGAVYGGSTGAAAGAMAGAKADAAQKQQRDAQLEQLKKRIGDDAFNGLAALAECKHDVSLAFAKTAAGSENRDYALAGLWLETLTYADRKQEDKARALFPEIVANDTKIKSDAQAEETMRQALQKLMDIRSEYNLPRVCN
jgi:hypothetical protein